MEPGQIVFEGKTKKGLDVVIRYPKAEDLMPLLEFINNLILERAPILRQKEIPLEEEQKFIDGALKSIKENKRTHLLVWHREKLAGSGSISIGIDAHRHMGDLAISVTKDFRGQGLGELLMDTLIKEAINMFPSIRFVKLEVFGDNVPAMSLYKKMGFVECGKIPGGALNKDGSSTDSVSMYKKI